jgi:Tfp pilus assembly protein PilV
VVNRLTIIQAEALRSERGAFLIEALVGAVLVAIVAVAMFSAVDGANQASGRTKTRALAASVAQNDQERLRSMPVSMLSNLRQNAVKSVDNVKYNVDSRADWISDNTSSMDCKNNGATADYMKITTTVTSPTQPAVRPVVVQSIVTPAPGTFTVNQGSLAVTIVDRNGKGVPNLTVSIAGPATASDVTDADGCAFFGYEPIGSYNVSTSRSGWVDVMGRAIVLATVNISSQQVSTKSLWYDASGSANVVFKTDASDYATATTTTARTVTAPDAVARRIRLTHSSMEAPYMRDGLGTLGSVPLWGDGTNRASILADNLFPFTSPYGVYAGDCNANDPAAQTPAQTGDIVQVNPGATANPTVLLPALNIHASANVTHVKITATSSGCTSPARVWTYVASDLRPDGNLKFPGLPYGSYTVCADNSTRKVSAPVNNFARAGVTTPVPMTVTGTSPLGVC